MVDRLADRWKLGACLERGIKFRYPSAVIGAVADVMRCTSIAGFGFKFAAICMSEESVKGGVSYVG